MILHSLNAYYGRLLAEGRIQPPGLQEKEIPFVVELDAAGRFVALRRTGDGKRGKRFAVPYEVKRSGRNFIPNLLWDNPEYVFGVPKATATEKQAAKVPARHAAFRDRLAGLPDEVKADAGVAAVLRFLEAADFDGLRAAEGWAGLIEAGANVSFKLAGEDGLVCERPAVRAAMAAEAASAADAEASTWCLVTGRRAAPALTHPSVKGVRGAQSSGANIVSFNLDAFTSHGWKQGENAPVGEGVAAAYVAALNHLLDRKNRTHHLVEGDTTFAFWAAEKSPLETKFAHLLGGFGENEEAESDGTPVRSALDSVRTGLRPMVNDDTPFYVLGLAPNAARLAVRFWHAGTVGGMAKSILRHFDDLDVDGLAEMRHPPGLWALLGAASAGRDPKKLSDTLRGRLAADLTAAVLEGTPYPATLLARTIARCRAEQGVAPIRAALVKASLKRTTSKEVTVSLDPDNDNPGYLLGRLFAALEDVQRGAQGTNINVTIRDRYFGAAVAAPLSVFVQLDKLKNAHLKKLKRINPGHAVNAEKLIAAITDRMRGDRSFPASLKLEDQGFFILGYHHQRNDFFAKSNAAKEA
jgi:CRISPR-associated protein Csd1